MQKKIKALEYKISTYIPKPAKTLLLGIVFCSFGVIYSTMAEDLPEAKGPFFYKADKGGKSLYLLGTLHFKKLDQLQCRSPIMSFLKDSDLLFTEITEEMVMQVEDEFLAGVSEFSEFSGLVFNNLNENSKRSLVNILKSRTQNSNSDEEYIAFLQHLNFWHIANFILAGTCISPKAGQQNVLDFDIQEIADKHSISQAFLDDAERYEELYILAYPFQNHLITAKDIISLIGDYDQLCNMVRENDRLYDEFLAMLHYRTGEINEDDIEDMLKLEYQISNLYYSFFDRSISEYNSFKAFKERMLKNRNQKWIEKIRQSHKNNNSVFIAVGLAHLLGSDNILDMLREDNFSIQRMDADCAFNSAL